MVYIKQTWQNNPPSTATPISAARLNHLETQYDEAIATLEPTVSEVNALSDTVNTGRLSETELSATIGERVTSAAGVNVARVEATLQGNRVVYLGDSITDGQTGDIDERQWGHSFPSFATWLSKGQLTRLSNAGISGNKASDMLARFDTDVAALNPSIVVIMAGTNDWNDSVATPLATYQANIRAIVAKCRHIGARPVLCTVPPAPVSVDRRKRVQAGNTWLRKYAGQEGITLVDFYTLLVDPTDGEWLSAYGTASNDKVHPIRNGYKAMGELLWETLEPTLAPVAPLLPAENNDPYNLLTNGLSLTTTGSGDTLMPTGWTVQSAHPTGITASIVEGDAAIKGNWWKVGAGGSVAGTNNEFQTVSGIVPGHLYALVGRFKATGLRNADSGNGSRALIGAAFNSSLNTAGYDFRAVSAVSYDVDEGVIYHEMLAPSDAATLLVRRQLLQDAGGAGTLQVAQMGLYDLTAMGLA